MANLKHGFGFLVNEIAGLIGLTRFIESLSFQL